LLYNQSYQLELQAYQTVFPDFKYKPPSFIFVEIGTSSIILATPFVVQLVTKPISPQKGGISLEIIPLLVQTFIIPISVTTIVSQHVKGSERSDKKQVELVNPSFTLLDSRLEHSYDILGARMLWKPKEARILTNFIDQPV
jgi:hypothetical protein